MQNSWHQIGWNDDGGQGTSSLVTARQSEVYDKIVIVAIQSYRSSSSGQPQLHISCEPAGCAAGRYGTGNNCRSCSAGQYCSGGCTSGCRSCSSGRYASSSGSSSCSTCSAGRAASSGSSSCTRCRSGRYTTPIDHMCACATVAAVDSKLAAVLIACHAPQVCQPRGCLELPELCVWTVRGRLSDGLHRLPSRENCKR